MLYRLLALLLAAVPLTAAATDKTHSTEQSVNNQINADRLKAWYDENKPMIVIDARSKKYFDGTLLPHAKWLPTESTAEEIQAAIPSKDTVVVVYCLGVDCPASRLLDDKLTGMGYKNVYEYHDGLKDWLKRGYPTTKQ